MKKFKNLYQKITDLDNIKLAHHNARKNKTHRDDVKKQMKIQKDFVSRYKIC